MMFVLSSCFEQPDCLINNTDILKIAVKNKSLGKDTIVTFVSVRTLKADADTYINKPLGSLEIPIQTTDTTTTVIFDYVKKTKLISDTLVVAYRNELRVISTDCGAYMYQHDLHVNKTNFERTKVTASVLLTTVKKNLEIYL